MVGDHLTYLHSECKPMVAGERRADLANLYRLLKPIAGAQAVSLDMHLCVTYTYSTCSCFYLHFMSCRCYWRRCRPTSARRGWRASRMSRWGS